ncbi:DUF2460 domain-containing protein [Sneathiella glossodoripedis]|uniref:DUF2460 domain-containing protein n=1 Tax=Sneathiella glossodoripedis TaxID=418853 RepID=UPI000472096D|nr:DUF2460 domain-containing protein [Sneathiella glossodoripedis]
MGFHDIRFPQHISYGAVGGPRFSTTIQQLNSGHERRNINWSAARREYRVDVSPSRGDEWRALLDFFHARLGRAYGFRLKDFADFELIDGVIATGDDTRQSFQICKIYEAAGDWPHRRDLKKIVPGSVSVRLDGILRETGWSVDTGTGELSFDTPPDSGAVISVSCEFDVPVRFDTDLMEAAIPGPDVHHWQSVQLVELRV